jgi:hypothetical protein
MLTRLKGEPSSLELRKPAGEVMDRSRLRKVKLPFGAIGAIAITLCASFALGQEPVGYRSPEDYKVEILASAWLQQPRGSIHGGNSDLNIDLERDLRFERQYNFLGIFNWRFARKHHFIFETNPSAAERTTTLDRAISFRTHAITVGTQTRSSIRTFHWYPQYQYNFIQRRRGHLGLNLGVDLFNLSAEFTALAGVAGGAQTVTQKSSGSLFAGLPTGGFEGRIFVIPGHNWLDINGHIRGMYFFGYGRYLETRLNGELHLGPHFGVQGG